MSLIERIQSKSTEWVSSHKTELAAAAWITGIALAVIGILCFALGCQDNPHFFHGDPTSRYYITLANGEGIRGDYSNGSIGMIVLGALGAPLGILVTIASAILFFKYEERNKTNLLRMLVALAAVTIIGVGIGCVIGGPLAHAMQSHVPDSTKDMFVCKEMDGDWLPLSNSDLNDYRALVASIHSQATRAIAVGATILATGGLALASVLYMSHRKRKGEATEVEQRLLSNVFEV